MGLTKFGKCLTAGSHGISSAEDSSLCQADTESANAGVLWGVLQVVKGRSNAAGSSGGWEKFLLRFVFFVMGCRPSSPQTHIFALTLPVLMPQCVCVVLGTKPMTFCLLGKHPAN